MKTKYREIGKRLIYSLILPVITYVLFWLICLACGEKGFGSSLDWIVIFRTMIYSGLISLAFSLNLTSGRFDFSVGSVLVLSTIIGTRITLLLGLNAVGMLAVYVVTGIILGALSGWMYTIIKVPTMVCSLGITMIFEAAGYLISGGDGVRLVGRSDLLIYSSQPYIYVIGILSLVIIVYLTRCTVFGYEYHALKAGQEIAVTVGIREKRNAVLCYMIAGGLLACAGIINMSMTGTCAPQLGLSSSSYMMNAFLPMFIGNAIGKYSDRNIGVMIGALTQAIIISAFCRLGLNSSLQTLLNAVIVMGFLFVDVNKDRFTEKRMFAKKMLELQEKGV